METKKESRLFEDFPAVATEAWEEVITADLKGADYEKKLVWKTLDNFKVNPYYRKEDLEKIAYLEGLPNNFPYIRGFQDNNDWLIRQDILVEDLKAANRKAINAIERGAQSIAFIQFGTNEFEVDQLLEGIDLHAIEVNFVCQHQEKVLEEFLMFIKKHAFNEQKVFGSLDGDPLKTLLLRGKSDHTAKEDFDILQRMVERTKELPNFQVIGISAGFIKNCGASITQELGYGLAAAVEYMDQLTERGLTPTEIAKKIRFNFGITGSYFPEIAKFRAAKLLWASILKKFGVAEEFSKMTIHASTSLINTTLYDPYVNMLRTTTEGMSAIIGNIHSLTINPFNASYEKTTEFSERIARNQQVILKEESNLDKVADIAAGSYYIENLTNSIAEEAWNRFLEVEEGEGFLKAIETGLIQDAVEKMAAQREKNIATRKETLLGTNQFPNFNEIMEMDVCECALVPADCSVEGATIRTLKPFRLSNEFERLRLETDRHSKRPIAFMLTIGNLTMRKARAQFSSNYFACAGYQVIDNNGFKTVEEGVEAAKKAKADIVVLCSSDDEYATYAPEAFDLIGKQAIFVVAGNPTDCIEMLKNRGIEHFVHVRTNILETLKMFNKMLGISSDK